MISSIYWINGKPPVAEPVCGFHGERCICKYCIWGNCLRYMCSALISRANLLFMQGVSLNGMEMEMIQI